MQKILVIVNPASAHGQTGKNWSEISRKLEAKIGAFYPDFTKAKGNAMQICRDFLKEGGKWVISVGGDGTLNEIVNGFFNNEKNMYPDSVLSVISTGTGGDFAKTLDYQFHTGSFLEKDKNNLSDNNVDVARLSCKSGIRYFINMASYGMGGAVVDRINRFRFLKKFGGKAGYYIVTLTSLLMYHNESTEIIMDDGKTLYDTVQNIAVGLGKYQGGGMMMAPLADIQDGLFDVIVMGDLGMIETILLSKKIYKGDHIYHPKIKSFKTSRLEIKTSNKYPLDIDGESFGNSPVKFNILPKAMKIRG